MKTSLRTPSATMLFAAATMLLLLSSLAQATAKKKYRHKCGKFREARSTTARIINGKTVKKHYPWMVKLDFAGETCGGSIIGERFVLTAAHCPCSSLLKGPLVKPGCDFENLGKKKTVPKEMLKHVTLFAGRKDVAKAKKFEAERVLIHKMFQMTDITRPQDHDIALVKTRRRMKFDWKRVGPLCLPKESTRDSGVRVLAAGWGALRTKVSQTEDSGFVETCVTDQYGPRKFKTCKSECEHRKDAPASRNCGRMWDSLSGGDKRRMERLADTVFVVVSKSKRKEFCYHRRAKEGWCYTKKNQTDRSKNWGFCTKSCRFDAYEYPEVLEVTELVTTARCYEGMPERVNRRGLEICAGSTPNRPRVARVEVDNKFRFESVGRSESRGKYGYFGFSDTCQGDSGGPLWIVRGKNSKKRAVLVGVISRGRGCASKGHPGIVTRVKKFLKWIKQNTK